MVVKILLNTIVLGVFMLYVVEIQLVYRVEMRIKGEIVHL